MCGRDRIREPAHGSHPGCPGPGGAAFAGMVPFAGEKAKNPEFGRAGQQALYRQD